MPEINILDFSINNDNGELTVTLNLVWLILLAIVFLLVRYLLQMFKKETPVLKEIIPVKMKYSVGGVEMEYEITRNYENVEIAHRILIELITRKAAIRIDKDHDVIVEVYDSWYSLFQITRDELKKISGKVILDSEYSESLVKLLSDILNKGLRPHLTEFQAKFRKWYTLESAKVDNESLSPQEIQRKYKEFDQLIESMLLVNTVLINYSEQLRKLIKGEKF